METKQKIECLKVNKFPEKEGERAGVYYYVISEKDKFSVYIGRLQLFMKGDVDNMNDNITSFEFGIDTRHLYVGTQKGNIHKFELPSPAIVEEGQLEKDDKGIPIAKKVGEPFSAEEQKNYDYSVQTLYRLTGILEEDYFILHVKFRGLKVYNADKQEVDSKGNPKGAVGRINWVDCPDYKKEIDTIKATPDAKFLIAGFRDT